MAYATDLCKIGESMRYKRFLWLTAYWNYRGVVIEWKTRTGRLYPVVSWIWNPK